MLVRLVVHQCCKFVGVVFLYTLLIVPKHVPIITTPQNALHSVREEIDKLNLRLDVATLLAFLNLS